ncbi:hypothetical protein JDV02_010512 [Purpureocillium takamizusanense]|uniref:Fungal N-terminal domain-containing protein n=1 Tax=Purpureocillium takamizusanense TaxID=2060973 RepID=A0A9Q8QSE6_9HYPO|nr:uncharacterized protein JDV02_010512 [Purpureocillium takamizusanense]UNI24788.1 hypothetical protein JDV02_010512 [Purpureocillium takamizusanense]
MDPTSVLSLIASCASLDSITIETTRTLHTLRRRLSTRTSETAVHSLLTQLQTLEACTSELKSLLEAHDQPVGQSEELVAALDACVASTAAVIERLRGQVSEACSAVESGKRWGSWAKCVTDEVTLMMSKDEVYGRVQVMQLGLTTVSLLYGQRHFPVR